MKINYRIPTNLTDLKRFLFLFQLPSNKRIQELKWFSVFDISSQSNFGDVYIPSDFDPPGYQVLLGIIFFLLLIIFILPFISSELDKDLEPFLLR